MNIDYLLIFEVICLMSIVILGLLVVNTAMDLKTTKNFVLKSVLQQEEIQRITKQQYSVLERLFSYSKLIQHVQYLLDDAKMNISASKFLLKNLIMSFLITILAIVLYQISNVAVFLYLSIPLGVLMFTFSFRTIRKYKNIFNKRIKKGLTEYMYPFAVLLGEETPYNATRKSIDYAGDLIKPYVQRLITEIELSPSSRKPYDNFAESVGVREAKVFVVSLQQIMKVDSKTADTIIEELISLCDQLEEEAQLEELENRPEEVENYVRPLLYTLLTTLLTITFILVSDKWTILF